MRTSASRAAWFVGGVTICGYCYLLVDAAAFGSGPLFLFEESLAHVTGQPFGVVTLATGVFFVLAALTLRAPVGPGTLAVPALFGLAVSLLRPLVPHIEGVPLRLLVFLGATHLMMLGAAMVVRASYGAAAADALMIGLARVSKRSLVVVRAGMELTLATLGVLLGARAGFGTAVSVIAMGYCFNFWARLLPSPELATLTPSRPSRHRVPVA